MTSLKKIKRQKPYLGYTYNRLRVIPVGQGLPPLEELRAELDEYMDILLGRQDAPVLGPLALMETADMFYGRSTEISNLIHRAEQDGLLKAADPLRKFRTTELRDFRELARRASDVGSRRLTALGTEIEQAKLGRESAGDGT